MFLAQVSLNALQAFAATPFSSGFYSAQGHERCRVWSIFSFFFAQLMVRILLALIKTFTLKSNWTCALSSQRPPLRD